MRQVICSPTSFSSSAASMGAAAAGRHKRADAYIDIEAALDHAGHSADHSQLLRKSLFERRPILGLCDLEPRQRVITLFVAPGDGNRKALAGFDSVAVVLERGAGQHPLRSCSQCREKPGRRRTETTVPFNCFWPLSDLCVWLRSNSESRSPKDSIGSSAAAGASSEAATGAAIGSAVGSEATSGGRLGCGYDFFGHDGLIYCPMIERRNAGRRVRRNA